MTRSASIAAALALTACASITPPPTPESARIEVTADREAVVAAFMDDGLAIEESSENVVTTAPVEIAPAVFVRYRASISGDRTALSGMIRNVQGEAVAGAGATEFPLHSEMTANRLRQAWLRLERIAEALEGE